MNWERNYYEIEKAIDKRHNEMDILQNEISNYEKLECECDHEWCQHEEIGDKIICGAFDNCPCPAFKEKR